MRLRTLASSILALSLLGGIATARPQLLHASDVIDVSSEQNPDLIDRRVDRAKVKVALAKRRAANLVLFRLYRHGGVYPHNSSTSGMLNVWQDAQGRLCAAASIMSASGSFDLANKIAQDNNLIRLADVRDGEIMNWILTSGFTQAEIDAIQEPFDGPAYYEAPTQQQLVEDRRLAKRYAQVDRQLVKNKKKSLDAAVDALMANPALARTLLAG